MGPFDGRLSKGNVHGLFVDEPNLALAIMEELSNPKKSSQVRINGERHEKVDPAKVIKLPDKPYLMDHLTVREHLTRAIRLRRYLDLDDCNIIVANTLEFFELEGVKNKRVGHHGKSGSLSELQRRILLLGTLRMLSNIFELLRPSVDRPFSYALSSSKDCPWKILNVFSP